MNLAATVNDVSVSLVRNSLTVDDVIDDRTVCRFIVKDETLEHSFSRGQKVSITSGDTITDDAGLVNDDQITVNDSAVAVDDDGTASSSTVTVLFTGYVEESEQEEPIDTVRFHTITAVGNHYLADKRLVARAYEMLESSEIVKNLHARYLADEGVILGNIDLGPIIDRVSFSYVPVSQAIDEIANRVGFWWHITPGKVLNFRRRDAFAAPWTLTDADVLRRPAPKLRHAAPDYRNTQYVRNVKDLTDSLSEQAKGDGEQQTFVVGYELAEAPTIRKFGPGILGEGELQTVGVRGADDDRDWFWSRGSNSISQGQGRATLAADESLQITYTGQFDAVVFSQDEDAVAERQSVEGGTGRVEHAISNVRIEGRDRAFSVAAAKLEQFGVVGRTLSFTTRKPGLKPGMLLTVDTDLFGSLRQRINDLFNSRYGVDGQGQFLIVEVSMFDVDDEVRYTVTAAEGPHEEPWSRFFARMYQVPDLLTWSENSLDVEIVTRQFSFEKDWVEAEVPNPFRLLYPANDLYVLDDNDPTIATFPMFDFDDRFTHIEIMAGAQVVQRKRLTARTGLETDTVTSTVYLGPNEGLGDISSVVWFGGVNATDETGSGIEIVSDTLVDNKNTSEAWNVIREDRSWRVV